MPRRGLLSMTLIPSKVTTHLPCPHPSLWICSFKGTHFRQECEEFLLVNCPHHISISPVVTLREWNYWYDCFPGIWSFIKEWSLCLFLQLPEKAELFRTPGTGSFLAHFTPTHILWAPRLGRVPILLWVPAWWPCRNGQCWPLTLGLSCQIIDGPLTLNRVLFVGLVWVWVCVQGECHVCAYTLPPSLIPSYQILHSPDWILFFPNMITSSWTIKSHAWHI